MTEEEALTKWCPHARAGSMRSGLGSMNRAIESEVDAANRCLASACMAWRWKFEQTNKVPYGGLSWPADEPIYRRTEHGNCGLAGGSL